MMSDPSMNSFNHYAYGAVAEWLYRYAAGIDEDHSDPGFHRIVLHPEFNAELGSAKASFDSPYGTITSGWKVDGNTTSWNVVVPANTSALIYFPPDATSRVMENGKDIGQSGDVSFVLRDASKTVYQAGAGSYSFTIQR
jgi:alpha-L-rhamnosidase